MPGQRCIEMIVDEVLQSLVDEKPLELPTAGVECPGTGTAAVSFVGWLWDPKRDRRCPVCKDLVPVFVNRRFPTHNIEDPFVIAGIREVDQLLSDDRYRAFRVAPAR